MNIAYSLAVQREEKVPALLQWNARHFGQNVSRLLSHPGKKKKQIENSEKLLKKFARNNLKFLQHENRITN